MQTTSLNRPGLLHALRCHRGIAAVEFALIATPLVFMLFAIIESGMIFVANIDLSNATMALGRQLRTGAVVAAGSSATTSGVVLSLGDFKTAICNKMVLVSTATCAAQLQVDVRTQAAFGTAAANPLSGNNFSNSSLCYNSGSSGSIVEFRAYYLWPISTPLLLMPLVNANSYTVNGATTSGNFHVIPSSEAFKIEQNGSGANSGGTC